MQIQPAYVIAARRTPVGKAIKGSMVHSRPDDMMAHVIQGLLKDVPNLNPEDIQDVIVGCAMPEGSQGMNVARISALLSGLPVITPGVTVNRFCASGLQSIAMAADSIVSGRAHVMIAGGTESMSQVPMGGASLSGNPQFFENDGEHVGIAYGMGITAEIVAQQYKVERAEQDAFALRSHERACQAADSGFFDQEILPYPVISRKPDLATGEIVTTTDMLELDEGPRNDTNLEALSRLKPVFAQGGSVTAGNSSQISDGAGGLILASAKYCDDNKIEPIARFLGFTVIGVPPAIMGIGPAAALPMLVRNAGIEPKDLGWIELNEAFAAQALAVMKELSLDEEIVNPMGGAIALGHPLGATGAIRAATLIHGLRRTGKRLGAVTMCIGTGMGAAGLFEAV